MDSFSSLMEFAVAIAGFSGITMAVQARNVVVHEVQTFRNTMLITFALAAAFSSAIPSACVHLGATGSGIWFWSSVSFAPVCGALLAAPFAVRSALSAESRGQLSRVIWFFSIGGQWLALIAQLANAAGVLGDPGPAPVYLGVLWMILMAALMYARMLIGMRRSSPA